MKTVENKTLEKSKTGDIITNDFDLEAGKIPALSTIKQQIKVAKTLTKTNIVAFRTEFDRLKIAVNLIVYGSRIMFEDWWLIDVEDPTTPPSYMKEKQREEERTRNFLEDDEKTDDINFSELFDEDDFRADEEIAKYIAGIKEDNNEDSPIINLDDVQELFKSTKIKKQIRYDDAKGQVGLINIYIFHGCLIIDITGKWMAENGVLGSLHKDNIIDALRKILELGVIRFNLAEFMEVAQVFVCDVCVDLLFDSKKQVERYIDGLSSFIPLASNRYNTKKYGRHGLMLKPKAQNAGMSFTVYSKGQELDFSIERSTRATQYTDIIDDEGVNLAQRTLRLEAKLYKLKDIRKMLDIEAVERGVVRLKDVLDSQTPVMWNIFEQFIGEPETLLKSIEWMADVLEGNDGQSLKEILVAERFIELFKENNFDLNITRSHIRTEYADVSEAELTSFNALANIRRNVLNFLVYRKPKTITIMLDMLRRLQMHYMAGMGDDNG